MLWIVVFLLVLVGCGGDKKSPNDILKDTQHRTYERIIRKKATVVSKKSGFLKNSPKSSKYSVFIKNSRN